MEIPVNSTRLIKFFRPMFSSLGLVSFLPWIIFQCMANEATGILPIHESLISLHSKEGRQLLANSLPASDYVSLSGYFETQINGAYCSVASSAMVLNALPIEKPPSEPHAPYRLFTQANFFSTEVLTRISNLIQTSRPSGGLERLYS